MKNKDQELIVADIGATNGRFAIAKPGKRGGLWTLDKIKIYQNEEMPNLAGLVQHYIDDIGSRAPARACLAIAGPVQDNSGLLTNLGWSADGTQLQKTCDLDHVTLVNDFAALAANVPHLTEKELYRVAFGEAKPGRPISVIGPGTGLGVTMLLPSSQGWSVVSTEGGHVAFAPVTELEQDLLRYLQAKLPHVSAEILLCGQGLVRIHAFLRHRAGKPDKTVAPADVTAAALAGSDPICVQTVQVFLAILGSVVGDLALAHGATGGVYLGGGVLQKIVPLLADSEIHRRFLNKGSLQRYLAGIPIQLVTSTDAALFGAARLFQDTQ